MLLSWPQKKAEMQMEEAIAAQKQELKKLEDQRDLKVMAAKHKAYSEADSGEAWDEDKAACSEVTNCPPVPCKEMVNKYVKTITENKPLTITMKHH